jgi:hypothetical protein
MSAASTSGAKVVLLNTGNYPAFSNYLNETWIFTGTDWTDLSSTLIDPNGPLPCRTDAVMAFDGYNTILYGGRGASSLVGVLEDTWVWNGTAWTLLSPATTPFGRCKAEACGLGNSVVMFGGALANGQLLAETWVWDGYHQTWAQVTSTNSATTWPAARIGHCMASNGTTVVLFGGKGYNSQYNSTWTYTAVGGWTKLSPTTSPSVRSEACMAYDSTNNIWVLFGGQNANSYLDETWTFDGSNWTQVTGTMPSGRIGAEMAFDVTSHKTILFGGINATTNDPANDTWSFNGATGIWTQL